jgi:hypothetical protein
MCSEGVNLGVEALRRGRDRLEHSAHLRLEPLEHYAEGAC